MKFLTKEQFGETVSDKTQRIIPKITIIPSSRSPRPKLMSQKSLLSTIGGSFDLDDDDDAVETSETSASKPQSSTNELPLTALNLEIFTSHQKEIDFSKMSTNELPLSDIKLGASSRRHKSFAEEISEVGLAGCKHQRSFSDPNILESELKSSDRSYWFDSSICFCDNYLWFRRAPSTLLSFLTSSPNSPHPVKQTLSVYRSRPSSPCVTTSPCMSYTESNSSSERRHRHGIAGQMGYFKMLGFGWGGPVSFKKMTVGSANSLFSTAVISGSSSAPNLRDMIPSATSVSEGFGGVPPIRPLETLHNALSQKQIDAFLDRMTTAPLFKTPSSTPPKQPSTPLPTPVGSQTTSTNLSSLVGQPLKLQSPSNSVIWSGPPSYLSSSGQSSPGLSETNSKESSELSSSVISGDGLTMDNISRIFPNTAAELDEDLGNVRYFSSQQQSPESDLLDYFGYDTQGKSGETTPISFLENTANEKFELKDDHNQESDKTFQDKTTSPIGLNKTYQYDWYPKLENLNLNRISSKIVKPTITTPGSKNTTPGSDKWGLKKEKFLDNNVANEPIIDKKDLPKSTVTIKESFIEPPRIGRISKSFHGKSTTTDSYLDVSNTPRRASDNMVNLTSATLNSKPSNLRKNEQIKTARPVFCTQKSQPCSSTSITKEDFRKCSLSEPLKGARFTTTLVDEDEHRSSLVQQKNVPSDTD